MSVPFSDRARRIPAEVGSLLCVGLDPDPERIPRSVGPGASARTLRRFLDGVVGATRPFASAYKFQLASYFSYGADGFDVLEETVRAIGPDRIRILDLKANDIPNTMRLYHDGIFDRFGFDAITVTPWIGWDSLGPFTDDPTHGVYVVAHSSNPGWRALQGRRSSGPPAWIEVLNRVRALARRSHNVGAVVGATYPAAVAEARRHLGDGVPLLVPGVGAQRGALERCVRAGIDRGRRSLLINASRSILYASGGEGWARACAIEAERLNSKIEAARSVATRTARRSAA